MSLFLRALKQYSKQCEQAGVIYQEPSNMSDDEFLESLKLENAHGTLARFSCQNDKLKFEGFGEA